MPHLGLEFFSLSYINVHQNMNSKKQSKMLKSADRRAQLCWPVRNNVHYMTEKRWHVQIGLNISAKAK